MDENLKKEWTNRLRSGKYRQGASYLEFSDIDDKISHCCLGVLCDLAVERGIIIREIHEGGNSENSISFFGDDRGMISDVLPSTVVEWAGLDGNNPSVQAPYDSVFGDCERWGCEEDDVSSLVWKELAELNDNGFTFEQIADWIDSTL